MDSLEDLFCQLCIVSRAVPDDIDQIDTILENILVVTPIVLEHIVE